MTTHGFDDLLQDPQIMRKLVVNSEGNLGIYASVVKVGKVATGDSDTVMQRPSGARGHPSEAPLSSRRPANEPLH